MLRVASPTEYADNALHQLTQRLANHFGSKGPPPSTRKSPEMTTLLLSNRYFSARVALKSIHDDTPSPDGLTLKEDGILLLSTTEDLRGLDTIHEQAISRGAGDLLRICVVVTTGTEVPQQHQHLYKTPKEIEEEYAKCVLWCLDRGYEYIPSCDLSDEGVSRGHDERDKDGFARLVEAIQGTVWSSAVMVGRGSNALIAPVESSPSPSSPGLAATQQQSTHKRNLENERNREEMARKALLEGFNEEDDNNTPANADAEIGLMRPVHHENTKREQVHNEHYFDQFEGAIREAARIRDLSLSGQLSDQERRQRAGDAALMLCELLDQAGFDEGESDVEQQESDEEES